MSKVKTEHRYQFSWPGYLIFFVFCLLVSVIFNVRKSISEEQEKKKIETQEVENTLRNFRSTISKEATDITKAMETLSSNEDLIRGITLNSQKKLKEVFADPRAKHGLVEYGVYDAKQNLITHSDALRHNWLTSVALNNAKRFLSPQSGGVLTTENASKDVTIVIVAPIIQNNKLIGFLRGDFSSVTLADFLWFVDESTQATTFISLPTHNGFSTIRRNETSLGRFKEENFSASEMALHDGALSLSGQTGTITREIDGSEKHSAFAMIPSLGIGITISKTKSAFAFSRTLFSLRYIGFAFIICAVGLALFWLIDFLIQRHFQIPRFTYLFSVASVLLGVLAFLSLSLFHYSASLRQEEHEIFSVAEERVEFLVLKIGNFATHLHDLGKNLANDLNSKSLAPKDVHMRLRRLLIEQKSLYAVNVVFVDEKIQDEARLSNIVREHDKERLFHLKSASQIFDRSFGDDQWPGSFVECLKQGGFSSPFIYPGTDARVISFCQPFFDSSKDKKPIGYVAVSADMAGLMKIFASQIVADSGYIFVLDQNDRIVQHPDREYSKTAISVLDLAQRTGDPLLNKFAKRESSEKSELLTADSVSGFVYYQRVPEIHWLIGFRATGENPYIKANFYFKWFGTNMVLFWLVGLLAFIFLASFFSSSSVRMLIVCFGVSGVSTVLLCFLWAKLLDLDFQKGGDGRIVRDLASAQSVLKKRRAAAQEEHDFEAKELYLGIMLKDCQFRGGTSIFVSGEVWLVSEEHMGNPPEIEIEEAFTSTFELFSVARDNRKTKWTYKFSADLPPSETIDYFPFDLKKVRLTFLLKENDARLDLYPDFTSYSFQELQSVFGLSETIQKSRSIERTFFSYVSDQYNTTPKDDLRTLPLNLRFSVEASSSTLSPFMLYGLPLLVIVVALFIMFLLSHRRISRTDSTISAYMAILFTLLLLHRLFREVYESQNIIYMEIFFLTSYFMIMLLFITTAASFHSNISEEARRVRTYRILMLYWPLFLSSWFVWTYAHFFWTLSDLKDIIIRMI